MSMTDPDHARCIALKSDPTSYFDTYGEYKIGLYIHLTLFGFSSATSLLCLFYLFQHWMANTSHYIVTSFTIVISLYNFITALLRAQAGYWDDCSMFGSLSVQMTRPDITQFIPPRTDIAISVALVPLFLWLSDAFLLYRAWVVWMHCRVFILLPAAVFTTSVVTGLIWLVQSYLVAIRLRKAEVELTSMQHNVFIWVPALGFSLGIDVITTGMIAGRLFYHHHRLQQKLPTGRSTPYLPALAIFIESGVLSTLSKVIQLAIECYSQNPGISPCVIPLCTFASDLIILRKALGADVVQMVAASERLSTIRFQSQDVQLPVTADLEDGSIPGGFEAHLIEAVGGHVTNPFSDCAEIMIDEQLAKVSKTGLETKAEDPWDERKAKIDERRGHSS